MRSGIFAGALALAAVSVLAGCGPVITAATPTPSTIPSVKAVSRDAGGLLSRPIKLAKVPVGSPCPVTAIARVSVGIGDPRGHGPFYLGGPMPNGGYAFNKMAYVVDGAAGPVLLRGGRLDGTGRLKFGGNPADPAEPAETLSASGGSWAFYQAVIGGTEDALYVYPSTKGCFAIQADGPNFEDVITITAT